MGLFSCTVWEVILWERNKIRMGVCASYSEWHIGWMGIYIGTE